MRKVNIRPGTGKKKPVDVGMEVNISGMGGLFKGLGNFIELVSEMAEKGQKEVERAGEFKTSGGRAMYGFSVKIGGVGPVIERFGNIIMESEKGPVVEEVREPFVDIIEEEDNLEIIAELPGVEEKDTTYEIKDDLLIIKAAGDNRKYSKEVLLPCKVSVLTTTYKNGIFRITLKKEKGNE